MKQRKLTSHEAEFIGGQVCTHTCGIAGCGFTYTCRLDVWLRVRDAHRAEAHPGYRPPKRSRYSIPARNTTRRAYDGKLEMAA